MYNENVMMKISVDLIYYNKVIIDSQSISIVKVILLLNKELKSRYLFSRIEVKSVNRSTKYYFSVIEGLVEQ